MQRISTKIVHRLLLTVSLLSVFVTALSGTALKLAPAGLLIVHLLGSLVGSLTLFVFLARHWWKRHQTVGAHPNAWLGYLTLMSLCGLGVTGSALFIWTNYAPLRAAHYGSMLVLFINLAGHTLWRIRRRWLRTPIADRSAFMQLRTHSFLPIQRPSRRGILVGLGAASLLALMTLPGRSIADATIASKPDSAVASETASRSTVTIQHSTLGQNEFIGAASCANCHADIVAQWRTTAHANSVNDQYYLALAGLFMQERGIEAVRYCATCHNPVGLMQGEIDRNAVVAAGKPTNAYEVRGLGGTLAISERAAEGVTCVICHQTAQVTQPVRNGSLQIHASSATLPETTFDRLVLRAVPDSHVRDMMPAAIKQSAMCGSCHNLHLPDNGSQTGFALEPTFDEWLNSDYPARGITCQDCHMPDVDARQVDSSLVTQVASHGGRPGAPSSLPVMADNPALLQTAATLSADVLPDREDPRALIATVTITNSGAGHYLPTGADDLRQVWLELTLFDAASQAIWQSGTLDDRGKLDPAAVQFRKVLGYANGQPIELHRFWVAAQIVSDTRLAPGETRQVSYRLMLDQPRPTAYLLKVRLRYRDVSPSFAEFALNTDQTDRPIFEMAQVTTSVP